MFDISQFTTALLVITATIREISSTGSPTASVFTTVKTREHETVFLPCYAGNLGSDSVRWWFEDTLVTDAGEIFVMTDNYRIHPNNTLEVIGVTDKYSGTYICQVKRPHPMTPIRHNYIIQVLYPPSVWMFPVKEEIFMELHQDITLYCNATGSPFPFITWTHDNVEIDDMRNLNSLTLIVTKETSGEYSCIASNGVGTSAMESVTVSAVYPPSIRADRLWIHTALGLRTVIECIIDASPASKVEWYKNNEVLSKNPRISHYKKDGNRYGIIIENSLASDVGHYTCVATNKLGTNKLPIEVSALADVAKFKSLQEKSDTKVTLVWEVESYPPIIQYNLLFRKAIRSETPENWTKLTIPSDDTKYTPIHTQTYTLTGLDKASEYEACIVTKNIFGWSRPSSIYKFSTSGFTVTADTITVDEVTEDINTITDFHSDYSTDFQNEIVESSRISKSKSIECSLNLIMLLTIIRLKFF